MASVRTFITAAFAALIVLCVSPAEAASGRRIALFISMEEGPFKEAVAGFRDYLDNQGMKPDYELFSLEGNSAKAGPAVQKIKQGGFDLIFTLGALATETALREITETPIVAGLILRTTTLKKSPNATGVGLECPPEMQFGWIRKILPEAHTIGVLYNPQENRVRIEAAAKAAQKMGLKLEGQEVSVPQDIPAALERLSQKADVLWGVADTVVLSPPLAKPILLFSFRNSIPFIGPSATWVKAGALWSLDSDYRDVGAQCAGLAEKILNGAAPGELDPEFPRSVNYSLNMNTARMMKIAIPDDVVKRALHAY